jgi:hypothetical protein
MLWRLLVGLACDLGALALVVVANGREDAARSGERDRARGDDT